MGYFQPAEPGQPVQAVPGAGLEVPIWILGSSIYGAQLAAMLGLPFAFASHFAPAMMMEAMAIYRARFRPSAQLAGALCDARASTSSRRRPMPRRGSCSRRCSSPSSTCEAAGRGSCRRRSTDFDAMLDPYARAMLADALACAIVGGAGRPCGRPGCIRAAHQRRRVDGDGEHLRPRQAEAVVRDRGRGGDRPIVAHGPPRPDPLPQGEGEKQIRIPQSFATNAVSWSAHWPQPWWNPIFSCASRSATVQCRTRAV